LRSIERLWEYEFLLYLEKEESSFSEEKEAKRLLSFRLCVAADWLRQRPNIRRFSWQDQRASGIKIFLLLFRKTKAESFLLGKTSSAYSRWFQMT
jgi:hypothetical protein